MSEENETFREVLVDVEPRGKEFKVAVMKETSVEEVISTLIRRCEDEGIRISDWGRSKVGQSNVSFILMRKATGNTAIAPTVMFGELFPDLEEHESFKLDARAQVGGLTTHIIEIIDMLDNMIADITDQKQNKYHVGYELDTAQLNITVFSYNQRGRLSNIATFLNLMTKITDGITVATKNIKSKPSYDNLPNKESLGFKIIVPRKEEF